MMKWTPRYGLTVLDSVKAEYLPAFRYALLRNGHIVSLFISREEAAKKCAERALALPDDEWSIKDRKTGHSCAL